MKISFFDKMLMKFFPKIFLKYSAHKQNINYKKLDFAEKLFRDCEKIHIEPTNMGRGFIITLDNKLSLWFFQDGKSFKYDGFEMGEYDDGDVTVFDELNKK